MEPISQLRFVVVGSGRSGTRYASELFTALDIPCGHEAIFGAQPRCERTLVGDASFGAAALLNHFDGQVFHQVRHPLAVLRSILATEFFSRPGAYLSYLRLIEATLPDIKRLPSPLEKAMHYIVAWNRLCEAPALLRWRVEELDADTLSRAAALTGHPRSAAACATALARVPRDVNRLELHHLSRLALDWNDIPDTVQKRDLLEATRRYGYASHP
jgi:hypothetical protein